MGLKDKHVLLGVSGSISAYKACDLVQRLKDEGAVVRVIMTHSATKLVHPNTFAALTGYKVSTEIYSGAENGTMDHIDLARWADIYLVAPCTAHTLSEFAQGLTGSLLSLIYLAYGRNVYLAPAMNSVMLDAVAVRRNLALLEAKGDIVFPTGEGVLACGEIGHGKLLEVSQIVAYLKSHLALGKTYPELAGKKVLISLGHTREKWDDVRFLSNRSSGKTGLALARAFQLAGAEVQVVAGIMDEALPPGLKSIRVETSAEFQKEMLQRQVDADILVMAAAIADFVPAKVHEGKQKGSKALANMELQPFPNILSELGSRKRPGQMLVGFALETADPIANGLKKMTERNCDFMVVNNPVAVESGFGKDSVRAAILTRTENSISKTNENSKTTENSGLREMTKDQLADSLLATLQTLLHKS
jgi:phosphopantothenoylcysteine decarboxylase / phosphopantothenate---cysteine ligase